MVPTQQPWRVDSVRLVDGVENVLEADAGSNHGSWVGRDLELGHLPTLHENTGDAIETIQSRLQVVGCGFPKLRLRDFVGREAEAVDWKAREIEPVSLDLDGRRQRRLDTRKRCVHLQQSLRHVGVPVEKEIHLSGASARDRTDIL